MVQTITILIFAVVEIVEIDNLTMMIGSVTNRLNSCDQGTQRAHF